MPRISTAKPGFLLVSHDRAFLDACIDQVIALNRDTVETERAAFSVWREHFRQRLAAQELRNAELGKEIARLGASARDRRAWAMKRESDKTAHTDKGAIGARAARQMKRGLVTERRAERSVEARRATLVDTEKPYPLKIECPGVRHSRALVIATDLVVHRDGPLFEPVSFRIAPGDRLAIVGPNGCGKTSLADLIAGRGVCLRRQPSATCLRHRRPGAPTARMDPRDPSRAARR